nr:cysteine-rich receptor-like protein kinase [Tanacetum cinerariifolium]
DNPHQTLKGKDIVDSKCSRHMTGNKVYLVDYQDFNGSLVAFGGSKGQITSKGILKMCLKAFSMSCGRLFGNFIIGFCMEVLIRAWGSFLMRLFYYLILCALIDVNRILIGEKIEISREGNGSFISIISKVADPIGLAEFRPISLIGCYYKIIAKISVKRVKGVEGSMVGEMQNALIKARFILDGVLIVNGTMDFVMKKKEKGLIFKLEGYSFTWAHPSATKMSNVDSVEWILVVMVKTVVEVKDFYKRMDKCCSEVVSPVDLQRMQGDLDCAHA